MGAYACHGEVTTDWRVELIDGRRGVLHIAGRHPEGWDPSRQRGELTGEHANDSRSVWHALFHRCKQD